MSDDLQRYRPEYPGFMMPDPDGVWVDRRDVAARIEALTAERDALAEKLEKAVEAFTKIAAHGYGLQGLVEDGASDNEIADYWMREVGKRRAIAEAALAQITGGQTDG